MTRLALSPRMRSIALVSPLLLFMLAFFVWPLTSVMKQSVSDGAVVDLLPETAFAIAAWDNQTPPTAAMKQAFAADLRKISDPQDLGELVRRLNAMQPGFRTLIGKTTSALAENGDNTDLSVVDSRWDEPSYWRAIGHTLQPYTDRYFLAAVDMQRDPSGHIVRMPDGTSANQAIIFRTFLITIIVTLACLLVGYPYALILVSLQGWARQLLLAAILLPLWTSLLVRTTAWLILLQENGIVNRMLQALHIIDLPLPLIFNRTGVIIAMTHVLLPLMVLPLYSVLLTIPRNLYPAACSLGASPLVAFIRVILPLSARGIMSGSLLVFMSAIGYYITPALVGGAKDQMISSIIAFYATGSANWGMASALGIVLLLITLALYSVYVNLSSASEGSR